MPQFGLGRGIEAENLVSISVSYSMVCSPSALSLAVVHSQSGCTDTSRLSERHWKPQLTAAMSIQRSPCLRFHRMCTMWHRRNFVCDDGDLSPPLSKRGGDCYHHVSKWNLYFGQENRIFLATRSVLWPKICRKFDCRGEIF